MEKLHPDLERAKIFFLISGIVNLMIMLGWGRSYFFHGFLFHDASWCFFPCLGGFLPLLNLACCIMDFITYSRLNSPSKGILSSVRTAAILDITSIITGNVISLILGIITLTSLDAANLKESLRERDLL
jgi:hypothetical protein